MVMLMKGNRLRGLLLGLALVSGTLEARSQQNAQSLVSAETYDAKFPPSMMQVEIPSAGAAMFGTYYVAAGQGTHPTVLLLHGFPGYEQNGDLAQSIRRAGWNVLLFHYRGAWGSHGAFSFTHAEEDTLSALAYLRQNAEKLRVNPKRIAVIGHSMGGFLASWAASHEAELAGVGMISAWNIGGDAKRITSPQAEKEALAAFRENTSPLAGCTAESLLSEAVKNAKTWDFVTFAASFKAKPVLIVESDDGLRGTDHDLAEALQKQGNLKVKEIYIATDHSYSGKRIVLATAVIDWLASL